MKLRDLQATFIQFREDDAGVYQRPVDALGEADGVRFLCPKCFAEKGSAAGVHSVVCWFEGKVDDEVRPGPGRWNPSGTGIDDLSFVPGRKTESVALVGGCGWHGFVRKGEAA